MASPVPKAYCITKADSKKLNFFPIAGAKIPFGESRSRQRVIESPCALASAAVGEQADETQGGEGEG